MLYDYFSRRFCLLEILEGEALAHDGLGTNILGETENIIFVIRGENNPNPDLNNDNKISFSDISIFMYNWMKSNDSRFDFNLDGKVTLSDINKLTRMIGE